MQHETMSKEITYFEKLTSLSGRLCYMLIIKIDVMS